MGTIPMASNVAVLTKKAAATYVKKTGISAKQANAIAAAMGQSTVQSTSTPGTNIWVTTGSSTSATNWTSSGNNTFISVANPNVIQHYRDMKIADTWEGVLHLPDGCKLIFDKGKYHIEDKDAKITYKANRVRDFNKFLSGSDLLEEFITYLGSLDMTKKEAMEIPIQSFIMWLIIRAAEHDQEDLPQQEVLMLETSVKQKTQAKQAKPHCKCCGRFIRYATKAVGIDFCSGQHMDSWLAKAA